MIIQAVNLTEGKHYLLRVNDVTKFQQVERIVNQTATIFGDIVDVYKYPGEDEVRVLMAAGTASGTGFARMVTMLSDLEGMR